MASDRGLGATTARAMAESERPSDVLTVVASAIRFATGADSVLLVNNSASGLELLDSVGSEVPSNVLDRELADFGEPYPLMVGSGVAGYVLVSRRRSAPGRAAD